MSSTFLALSGMKANPNTTAKIRSIIRWTTGATTAAIILTAACSLFPLLTSFSAFTLVLCLSVFAGLNIALPPVDPEEDWVPVRSELDEESGLKTQSDVIPFPSKMRTAV